MLRKVITGASLATAVALGLILWVWQDYQRFLSQPLSTGPAGFTYRVAPGSSLRSVAVELAQQGHLRKPRYLAWAARLRGQHRQIKAGEFFIPAGTTPVSLLELLVSGRVLQHRLTLLEGWTFEQVLNAVAKHAALSHTLAGYGPGAVMDALQLGGIHPEGRFFPDTYLFPSGTTDVQFLRRAYDRMQQVLKVEWERRDPSVPLRQPYEALILASIVEKETGRADERGDIAGVFVRRLRRGMKLQTDPTIIYGLRNNFNGDLKRVHLQMDHPYNTYVYEGLPPTPIAAPGRESIRAALNPAPGDALYFVSKGDGSHHFSATLAEHDDAVMRYQLSGRQ